MTEEKKIEQRKANLIPRVLLACPSSIRHKEVCEKWIKHLNTLTYINFDVCIVDTTADTDEYFKLLKTKKVKGKEIITWRSGWDKNKRPFSVQMLADVRQEIQEYFLKNNYDNLFWLDDDIFIPKNGIQKLLWYDKDCVGFYVHVYPKGKHIPCVFKSGEIIMGKGLEYFTFAEIKEYKKFADRFVKNKLKLNEQHLIPFLIKDKQKPYLFNTYAVNLGCLMVKHKVVEKVPFRTHEQFIMGEDLWWFAEANDKKFEFWCDSSCRPRHENTSWDPITKQEPRKAPEFWFALGPSEGDKVEIIKRDWHLRKRKISLQGYGGIKN